MHYDKYGIRIVHLVMYGNVLIVCKQLLLKMLYYALSTGQCSIDCVKEIHWLLSMKNVQGQFFFFMVLWFETYNNNSSAEDAVGELWIYYWSSMSYTFFIILIMTIIVVDNGQQSYKSLLVLGNNSRLIKCCVLVKNCCMDDVTMQPSYFCLLWGLVCVTSCNFKMNKLIKTVT